MKRIKETKWVCDFCGAPFDRKRDCDAHEHMVHNNERAAIRVVLELNSDPNVDRWDWWEFPMWVNAKQFMLNVLETQPMGGKLSWFCFCEPGARNVRQAKQVLRNYVKEFLSTSIKALDEHEA